jgi:hypothetical protein
LVVYHLTTGDNNGISMGYIYNHIYIYWLVISTILKNISHWEGLSHILWKITNVPNHQPVYNIYIYAQRPFHTFSDIIEYYVYIIISSYVVYMYIHIYLLGISNQQSDL